MDADPDSQRIWADYLAGSWAVVNPAAAFDWIQGIPAGEHRVGALDTLFEAWNRSDPPAAHEAIRSGAELTEDERVRLLERLAER